MTSRARRWVATAALAVAMGAFMAPAAGQDAIPPATEEIVHSWALAPAGSGDPGAAGNRPVFSYDAAPGTTVDDALTLFNYSNVALSFEVYATDAFNNESGAFDLLPASEEPTDVGRWVTLPQESITVPAGAQATMPITITIPRDASPGDHAGAILASSAALGTGPDGAAVAVDRRTGSRIYVRVAGDLQPELAVESVETTYTPSLNPLRGDAEVTYRIRNRGNVRLGGEHRASVAGPFGFGRVTSSTQTLEELLPGEETTITLSLEGVPAGVLDRTKVELRPLAVGTTEGDYDPVARTGLSLALPVSLIGLLVAGGLATIARRQYRRRRVQVGVAMPAAR